MVLFSNLRFFGRDLQDARKKLSDMENKRKNSGEEAEKLRNALQEAVDKAKNANKEVSITINHSASDLKKSSIISNTPVLNFQFS